MHLSSGTHSGLIVTMGWLWGSADDATSSKTSKDGAYVAPDRTKRVMCWDSRDDYFQCLNRNNILDALKEHDAAAKACSKETQAFEQNCASSWVSPSTFITFFSLNSVYDGPSRVGYSKWTEQTACFGRLHISITRPFVYRFDIVYQTTPAPAALYAC